jgi:predicted ATPase
LRLVQLGLGDEIEDVSVQIVADSGYASLALRYADGRVVSAMAVSDGQLAYLSFVALVRGSSARSVLVVDEPELHLHPGLVVRVLDLLDSAAAFTPVILATHSNDLLDALERPEDVRIVSLVGGRTQIAPLRSDVLERWRHRSLSSVRRTMGDQELSGP